MATQNVPTIPLKLSIDFFYLKRKNPMPTYFGKKETLTTITSYKDWRNSMVLYSIRWPRIDLGLKIQCCQLIKEREGSVFFQFIPGLAGVRKALRRIAHLKEAVEEALVFSIYTVFLAVKSTNPFFLSVSAIGFLLSKTGQVKIFREGLTFAFTGRSSTLVCKWVPPS